MPHLSMNNPVRQLVIAELAVLSATYSQIFLLVIMNQKVKYDIVDAEL